jgi:hypothetical protein
MSNTKLAKAAKFILPSGLGVLSEASEGPKRIALDTAGSLFISEDGGKHWLAVKASWTGRAIAVRTQPAAAEISENAPTRAFPVFELSTDDSQKWISVDGQHWSLEPQRER